MSTPDRCPYCGAEAIEFKPDSKLDLSWYRMYKCGTKYMDGLNEDGDEPLVDIEESRQCLRNRLEKALERVVYLEKAIRARDDALLASSPLSWVSRGDLDGAADFEKQIMGIMDDAFPLEGK